MISAHEAQKIILKETSCLGTEKVPLSGLLRRYLAVPITAPIHLPPFDNAAMDGFAIRSGDTEDASQEKPVSLNVIGTIAAGDLPPSPLLIKEGARGRCFRIMTGAPIPGGADAVVPFEETSSDQDLCFVTSPVKPGANIRKMGEDVVRGEVVLESGEFITSRTIALLAALGIVQATVFKKPRVQIVSTGSEILDPGHPLPPGKIYNSNGPALTAALHELGITPQAISSVVDRIADLKKVLLADEPMDVLITIGAVSAGDFDFIPQVLKEVGAEIIFHKVSIKPGKPLLFALWERKLIFSLPGNPVSALMVFERFVRPALLKMMGAKNFLRQRKVATAREILKGNQGKENYLRGTVEFSDGRFTARSAGKQGSAQLLSLARANAILILPPEKEEIRVGEKVEFETFMEDL